MDGADAAAAAITAALRAAGTPERAAGQKAYLKSNLEFFGAPVPAIRSQVRFWCRSRPALGHDEVVAVAAALWDRPVNDCRVAAELLLEANSALLDVADVPLIERMLREARTWALVDGLAANVMGALVDRRPELGPVLDRWAGDDDFWLRRSALLALLVPLRRGAGDFTRFSRYADSMIEEKEFFIRKAIGWVLRETGKKRPGLVAEWLAPRVRRVSGVTLREALKPLPDDVRSEIRQAAEAAGDNLGEGRELWPERVGEPVHEEVVRYSVGE
jgi:3-methyladenine DNA glycosylase AlkD